MKIKFIVPAILLFFTLSLISQERKDLSITVYNSDLGVVREKRTFNVPKGISEIKITDIPESIDPTSVLVKFNGTVLEQNYQFDLVNVLKILARYIGNEVTLASKDQTIIGKLLSANTYQIVVQTGDGNIMMITDNSKYTITVKDLPDGLITKPTLVWKIQSEKAGNQDFEITYSTSGLNWHAEYVALLNENDTKLDLNSWVSLDNKSGGSYPETELKLIAGDINRVSDNEMHVDKFAFKREVMMDKAYAPAQFEEKALFEYHIYNLQRTTTLKNMEIKQVSLFNATNVKAEKKFKYKTGFYGSSENNKVGVFIEFKNGKENNLGMPMPKGKFRIFKSDGNSKEFVGEDKIDHTPKDEDVKLKIGDAFDILVDEVYENDRSISKKVSEKDIKITVKNHKEEKAIVEIEANMGYGKWDVLESNVKFEKKDARTAIFKVPVEKNTNFDVKLKIRNQWN